MLGGTAAAIHGADTLTLDTDVTPDRSPDNLARLAHVLHALGARLRTPEGDLVNAPLDEAALRNYTTCATRTADAGDLDLVFAPDGIPGGYETLARDARHVRIAGRDVAIASVEHIAASRDAAYRKTQQAKYARGNDALTIAVDVADQAGRREPNVRTRAEQAADLARRYRAQQHAEPEPGPRRPPPSTPRREPPRRGPRI